MTYFCKHCNSCKQWIFINTIANDINTVANEIYILSTVEMGIYFQIRLQMTYDTDHVDSF